jgi:hypothetical protein
VNVLLMLATANAVSGRTGTRWATSASPAVPVHVVPSDQRIVAEMPGVPVARRKRFNAAWRARDGTLASAPGGGGGATDGAGAELADGAGTDAPGGRDVVVEGSELGREPVAEAGLDASEGTAGAKPPQPPRRPRAMTSAARR